MRSHRTQDAFRSGRDLKGLVEVAHERHLNSTRPSSPASMVDPGVVAFDVDDVEDVQVGLQFNLDDHDSDGAWRATRRVGAARVREPAYLCGGARSGSLPRKRD